LSVFKKKTCVLHHLAFLVWLPTRIFATPNYPLLAPKTPPFNGYFALLAMFFMAPKGFVYTICSGYLCFSPCILHHFTLHFAPKRTPFSTKTRGILHQNARRLAAKRTPFCCK